MFWISLSVPVRDAIHSIYIIPNYLLEQSQYVYIARQVLTTVSIWRVTHSGHQCVAFCLKVNLYHSPIHQSSVQVTYNGIELQYNCTLC